MSEKRLKGVDDLFHAQLLLKGFEGYRRDQKQLAELKTNEEQKDFIEENLEKLTAYYTLDNALAWIQKYQDENEKLREQLELKDLRIQALETQLRTKEMERVITV